MAREGVGVAEIFRHAGGGYRERMAGRLDAGRLKVMGAIETCRTAALGGHMYRCDGCVRVAAASHRAHQAVLAEQGVRCFEAMACVPLAVVPDNIKPAVKKPSRYEPVLNETSADLLEHYGAHGLRARSRRPRDKGLVENG